MDEATPLVSVIMSVHNGERWLKEAIDSIVNQTYTRWEFIIIDDASTDNTWQILQTFPLDKSVTTMRLTEKNGLTRNLGGAIVLTNGEFIARMDADDISEPDRLAKQVAFLQKMPSVDVVACFVSLIDEKGDLIRSQWEDDRKTATYSSIRAMLPSRNCIAHPSVMMRASVVKAYNYNPAQTHSQDWDLWLRMINDGRIIEKIQEPLLRYRVHNTSVTSTTNKKSAFAKKDEFYKRYLANSIPGSITSKVKRQYLLNRVKLFLSRIKRRFTS
jgi:glycosyltransferase involved in cell wall biosynthesis